MIYVTGDTHGEQTRLLHAEMTDKDTLIVCGDFGFLFYGSQEEQAFLDRCERSLPYAICFVDGNHENFDLIAKYPVEEWSGGHIHRIRKNVIHLMRGQVYEIEGKTFFSFGGGYSIDRAIRQDGISWWPQELPTDAEYKLGVNTLKEHDMRVDYILTHTAPREMVMRLGHVPDPHENELEGYLEYLMYETKFKHWYCGHWHVDKDLTDHFSFLWFDTVCIK